MATIIKYNTKEYPIPSTVAVSTADAIGIVADMGNAIDASNVDVTESIDDNGNRVLTITPKPKTKG